MHDIETVSSLNLRTRRGKPNRSLEDPFRYYCSFCGKRRTLGTNDSVLTKIRYCIDDGCKEVKMCSKCTDVFADCLRYGPSVLSKIYRWERRSRVVRVSFVEGERFCHMCLGTTDTHIFVKYDNVETPGDSEDYQWVRVCARCALAYMEMMIENEDVNSAEAPFIVPDPLKRYS